MINILVIDDNRKKSQRINEILTEIEGISDDNITIAPDIINAKRSLLEKEFDLLLLDIQIPNRFDQKAEINGGLNFLNQIKSSNKYSLPNKIIGITAYEDSYNEVVKAFSDKLIVIIKYDDKADEWADKIKNHIDILMSSNTSYSKVARHSYDFDLAIICALDDVEFESIKDLSDNWELIDIPNDSTSYYKCFFEKGKKRVKVIAATANHMGMTAASVLSMKLIHNFSPRYLAMIGIAVGVRDAQVNLGDVLVADPSWDYGNGKIKNLDGKSIFNADPKQIRLNVDLKEKFKRIKS